MGSGGAQQVERYGPTAIDQVIAVVYREHAKARRPDRVVNMMCITLAFDLDEFGTSDPLSEALERLATVLDILETREDVRACAFGDPGKATGESDGRFAAALQRFVEAMLPHVENFGSGALFAHEYMQRLITIFTLAGLPCFELYLAHAKFLRLDALNDKGREQAIVCAIEEARAHDNKRQLMRALVRQASLYNDISQYHDAQAICRVCAKLIAQHPDTLGEYWPEVWTESGITFYTRFQYQRATRALESVCATLQSRVEAALRTLIPTRTTGMHANRPPSGEGDLPRAAQTLATAIHYLGRIDEAKGDLRQAMERYVQAERYKSLCPPDVTSGAYVELRLAEVLLNAAAEAPTTMRERLIAQAVYHAVQANNRFTTVRFKSSGVMQSQLVFARIDELRGRLGHAREEYKAALLLTDRFPRGELLCREAQFWFELRHGQIYRAISILLPVVVGRVRGGEVTHQGGLRLYGIYLLRIVSAPARVLRRGWALLTGAQRPLSTCLCVYHDDSTSEGQ